MYIIDKHRDFYDFHSHIYGADKKVIFDRRGSVKITDSDIIRKAVSWSLRIPEEEFFLLEIGNKQYLIEISNIKKIKTKYYCEEEYSGDFKIVRTFGNLVNRFGSVVSIHTVDFNYEVRGWDFDLEKRTYSFEESFQNLFRSTTERFVLPILAETSITSLLDSKDVWIEIQTYISSLNNDKDASTPMTDEEKAEVHGFDRKTSFRNPIK